VGRGCSSKVKTERPVGGPLMLSVLAGMVKTVEWCFWMAWATAIEEVSRSSEVREGRVSVEMAVE
jgi:hypothetical protein